MTWNWQTDIIGRSDSWYGPGWSNGKPVVKDFVSYYDTTEDAEWSRSEIVKALLTLSDEELKVCLLHQPMLSELIAKILQQREEQCR
jgi:hypothetical protein